MRIFFLFLFCVLCSLGTPMNPQEAHLLSLAKTNTILAQQWIELHQPLFVQVVNFPTCTIARVSQENAWTISDSDWTIYTFFPVSQISENCGYKKYRVEGYQFGSYIIEKSISISRIAPPVQTPLQFGVKTLLYVRMDFEDKPGEFITVSQLNTVITASGQFLNQNSYGAFSLGSFTVSSTVLRALKNSTYYPDYNSLMTDALNVTAAAGYVVTNYNFFVVGFPKVSQFSWAGLALVKVTNGRVWINGPTTGISARPVLSHEMGHNLGLQHSNRLQDNSPNPIPFGGSNTVISYGDTIDTMGLGDGHFNPVHKAMINWLPSDRLQMVTTSNDYLLYAHDDTNNFNKTLALLLTHNTGFGTQLSISFRSLYSGYNPSAVLNNYGALDLHIVYFSTYNSANSTHYIHSNYRLSTIDKLAPLRYGFTFHDPTASRKYFITFLARNCSASTGSCSSATVRIRFDDPTAALPVNPSSVSMNWTLFDIPTPYPVIRYASSTFVDVFIGGPYPQLFAYYSSNGFVHNRHVITLTSATSNPYIVYSNSSGSDYAVLSTSYQSSTVGTVSASLVSGTLRTYKTSLTGTVAKSWLIWNNNVLNQSDSGTQSFTGTIPSTGPNFVLGGVHTIYLLAKDFSEVYRISAKVYRYEENVPQFSEIFATRDISQNWHLNIRYLPPPPNMAISTTVRFYESVLTMFNPTVKPNQFNINNPVNATMKGVPVIHFWTNSYTLTNFSIMELEFSAIMCSSVAISLSQSHSFTTTLPYKYILFGNNAVCADCNSDYAAPLADKSVSVRIPVGQLYDIDSNIFNFVTLRTPGGSCVVTLSNIRFYENIPTVSASMSNTITPRNINAVYGLTTVVNSVPVNGPGAYVLNLQVQNANVSRTETVHVISVSSSTIQLSYTSQPATSSPKPATSSSKPATSAPKPTTSSPTPTTSSPKPVASTPTPPKPFSSSNKSTHSFLCLLVVTAVLLWM